MVVWIIGLAGAGKTTLGGAVTRRLRDLGRPAVLLDGDAFREATGPDLGHTPADRAENGRRIGRLCGLLEGQGIDIVACLLSNDPTQQAWNRMTFGRYVEVFLDTPRDTLEARDQKGLYSGARAGRVRNVVGFDIPFVRPPSPDIVLSGADALAPTSLQAERVVGAVLAARLSGVDDGR
jgi:adenylylsulfate kinase